MNILNLIFYSLFLISFSSGLSLLLSRLFRLEPSFALFFSQSLLIIIMFIAGLLDILNISSIILPIGSIIYLIYLFFLASTSNDGTLLKLKLFFKQNYLVYAALLVAPFIFDGQFVGHNDEFNFWASSVKEMLSNHRLATADSAIYYKMYHPGLTLYHYVNLRIIGNLEPNIYISYLLLNLSAINIISHRFRNFNFVRPLVFICITWLSYKVLGLGFKMLIADQYLANAFFACLFIILFSMPVRKLTFLIIPISALALAKHPGLMLGVVLLLLLNFRRFSSPDILNNVKTLRGGMWVLGALIFEIVFFVKFSTAWTTWIDSHLMAGMFTISMSTDSLSDVMQRFAHGIISSQEIEIFKQFLDTLLHLKIGIPLETQLADTRWAIFVWLIFCSLPLLLARRRGGHVKRTSFNLTAFLVISCGLLFWILGIYFLAIKAFQFSSEGLFPSMDRYIGIYLSAIILYAFSYIAYWGVIQKTKRLRIFAAIGLLSLTGLAPSASFSFFNERELVEGKVERDLFNQLDRSLVSELNKTSKVCVIYNGSYPYVPAIVFGILPARTERADTIANLQNKIPNYAEISCTHFIGFCVDAIECTHASNRFPTLFNSEQHNQIWLKTYDAIKSEL